MGVLKTCSSVWRSHLVQVLHHGALLPHKELSAGVCSVVLRPEGAHVHSRRLCGVDQGRHAPEQGSVDPHQVLGGEAVCLVEDQPDLGLTSLHLPEEHLQLASYVQLGGVEHEEDQIRSVDEPLAHLVVRVT